MLKNFHPPKQSLEVLPTYVLMVNIFSPHSVLKILIPFLYLVAFSLAFFHLNLMQACFLFLPFFLLCLHIICERERKWKVFHPLRKYRKTHLSIPFCCCCCAAAAVHLFSRDALKLLCTEMDRRSGNWLLSLKALFSPYYVLLSREKRALCCWSNIKIPEKYKVRRKVDIFLSYTSISVLKKNKGRRHPQWTSPWI